MATGSSSLAVPVRRTRCAMYRAVVFGRKVNLMDPNACYAEMREAMEEADRWFAVARERAVALLEWLKGGGFYPEADSPEIVRISICQVLMRTDEPEEE